MSHPTLTAGYSGKAKFTMFTVGILFLALIAILVVGLTLTDDNFALDFGWREVAVIGGGFTVITTLMVVAQRTSYGLM